MITGDWANNLKMLDLEYKLKKITIYGCLAFGWRFCNCQLWIRIHFLRIRIRIQWIRMEANTDPDTDPDPDPDPDPIRIQGFNDQKLKKKNS